MTEPTYLNPPRSAFLESHLLIHDRGGGELWGYHAILCAILYDTNV